MNDMPVLVVYLIGIPIVFVLCLGFVVSKAKVRKDVAFEHVMLSMIASLVWPAVAIGCVLWLVVVKILIGFMWKYK